MPAVKFDITKFDLSTSENAAASWRKSGFGEKQVALAVAAAWRHSPENTTALASGLLDGGLAREKTLANSHKLIEWAAELTPKQHAARRAVLRAYKETGCELLLAHQMASLSPAKTKLFAKDYVAEGLSATGLAEWFRLAGKTVRERSAAGRPKKTRGRAASPKKSKGLVGEVTLMIEGTDAKLAAVAKNLAAATEHHEELFGAVVNDIANRAINEVADFIEILEKTGRPLPQILGVAADHGSLVLKKFVHGALDAGHEMAPIIEWAVVLPAETVKSVLQALIDLGKRLSEIVALAAHKGPAAARVVAQNLSEIGQTVGAVLAAAASQSPAILEAVVQGVLDAGRPLRDMLAAVANMTPELARGTVHALLQVGRKCQEILEAVILESASVVREVVAALLAAGRKPTEILEFLIRQSPETARVLLSALLRSGQSLASLLKEGLKLTRFGFQSLLRAMIGAGIAKGEILMAVATSLPEATRTTLEGLLQIGLRLTEAVRSILTDVQESYRKGFIEALVALGLSPLEILKAADETGPAALFQAVTVFFEIWGGYRNLNDPERREAEIIFGSSIDLNRVKIASGTIPSEVATWINARTPFTTMYLLNFAKADSDRDDQNFLATLIHELVHVWQGVQSGPIYLFQSVCAPLRAVTGSEPAGRGAAHRYTVAALERNKGDLRQFNPEQQAAIVEDFWIATRSSLDVAGIPPEALLHPYARQVFRPLRGRAASRAAAEKARVPLAARRTSQSTNRSSLGESSPSRTITARKTR
jgi:hypothetical protein